MTGHGDIPMTVPAMQAGAVECLTNVERGDRCVEGCLAYRRRGGTAWSPPPTREEGRRAYDRGCGASGSDPPHGGVAASPLASARLREGKPRALAAGAVAFLSKPCHEEDLLHAIEAALKHS